MIVRPSFATVSVPPEIGGGGVSSVTAWANLGCGPGCGAIDVGPKSASRFSWPFVLQATAANAARSDVTFHPWFMTTLSPGEPRSRGLLKLARNRDVS